MSDYIKREDAIKALHDEPVRYIKAICDVPSADVVEVVRCKDCKYRYLSGVGKQYYVCDFLDAELKENGYCSYGERKDNE